MTTAAIQPAAPGFGWASLEHVLGSTLVLNLADLVMTLTWVFAGIANESNALMAPLVYTSPTMFAAAKIGLVSLGVLLIWRNRARALARRAGFVAFLSYVATMGVHFGGALGTAQALVQTF